MSNNRSVRQYYRHIIERRPGIKGKRKGDPPKLCSYCKLSFKASEKCTQKRFTIGLDKIFVYLHKEKCQDLYRPKLANGVSSQNGNGKRKEADTKKIKPTITNKGTSHLSIGELILLLNDEQLARLFIYCYTQKGLNAPLPVNAMLGVLNNMSKVAECLAQCEIIDRLQDSLDPDSSNYSQDIAEFEREFRTIDMGDRLRMADEIGNKVGLTLELFQKDASVEKAYFFFREWISRSFLAELAIPHKSVSLGEKSK